MCGPTPSSSGCRIPSTTFAAAAGTSPTPPTRTSIVPADPIPDHVRNGQYEISGSVTTGTDERVRGTRDAAPLRIDGSRGDWAAIEDRFIEDIGAGSDGWEFGGSSYSVEIR
ncbi:hypothetical protein [Streptomyces sp. NPDC101455]|uniref:hypothetical protein n=1 Tax=Streptomyces sp. NPDC101455 TaxID=3366142 RepID=UPI0037F1E96F